MSDTLTLENEDDDDSEEDVKIARWLDSSGRFLAALAKLIRAVSAFF
jgi:hypothetical protein